MALLGCHGVTHQCVCACVQTLCIGKNIRFWCEVACKIAIGIHYCVSPKHMNEQSGQAVTPHTSSFYHKDSVQDCCYSVAADKAYDLERGVDNDAIT